MPAPATSRQKQFLRQLGHKDVSKLTKQQASKLIDKLLAKEKASGKTFPCPYCKKRFGPRPKRTKNCPACGKKIIHLSGRFFTEQQADERYQKDWLKESLQEARQQVRDDWKEEKSFRREFKEPLFVGYKVKAGPACPHTKKLEGVLVLIEDAYDMPDMLPPYEECKHDSCECEFEAVMANEVKRGTRVAEFEDPKVQAKLTTHKTSPVSTQKKSGCLGVVLSLIVVMVVISQLT